MRLLVSMEVWRKRKLPNLFGQKYLGILAVETKNDKMRRQWQHKRKLHCFGCGLSTCQWKYCNAKITVRPITQQKRERESERLTKEWKMIHFSTVNYYDYLSMHLKTGNFKNKYRQCPLHKFFAFANTNCHQTNRMKSSEQMSHARTHQWFYWDQGSLQIKCDERNDANVKIPNRKKLFGKKKEKKKNKQIKKKENLNRAYLSN